MLVGRQKYGDEVMAVTLLRDVMRGPSVPPTRIHYRPDSRPSDRQPSSACLLVYMHYYLRTGYTSSRVS